MGRKSHLVEGKGEPGVSHSDTPRRLDQGAVRTKADADLRREGPGSWGTITNPPSRVCSDHLESFLSSVHLGKKRPGGKASGNRVRKG